jgi:hypothetical protein
MARKRHELQVVTMSAVRQILWRKHKLALREIAVANAREGTGRFFGNGGKQGEVTLSGGQQ